MEDNADKEHRADMKHQTDNGTPGGNVNQNIQDPETPLSSGETLQSDSRMGKLVSIFGVDISVGAVLAWGAVFALLLLLFFGLRRSQEG
ncbi:MAG: hypothetical protein MUO67_10740, partial [Anaerolineales bacterium]|nr:hypothetical protein [Anaerolineales bacterium]